MDESVVKIKEYDKMKASMPVTLFGKDVREIKCFRKSFIIGICSGVVGGLASFMFTSKMLFSTNISVAFLWIGVAAYWIPCRVKYESTKIMMEELSEKKLKEMKEKENKLKETS